MVLAPSLTCLKKSHFPIFCGWLKKHREGIIIIWSMWLSKRENKSSLLLHVFPSTYALEVLIEEFVTTRKKKTRTMWNTFPQIFAILCPGALSSSTAGGLHGVQSDLLETNLLEIYSAKQICFSARFLNLIYFLLGFLFFSWKKTSNALIGMKSSWS